MRNATSAARQAQGDKRSATNATRHVQRDMRDVKNTAEKAQILDTPAFSQTTFCHAMIKLEATILKCLFLRQKLFHLMMNYLAYFHHLERRTINLALYYTTRKLIKCQNVLDCISQIVWCA